MDDNAVGRGVVQQDPLHSVILKIRSKHVLLGGRLVDARRRALRRFIGRGWSDRHRGKTGSVMGESASRMLLWISGGDRSQYVNITSKFSAAIAYSRLKSARDSAFGQ